MKPTLAAKYFILSEGGTLWTFKDKPEFFNDSWSIFPGVGTPCRLVSGDMTPGELYQLSGECLELIPRPVWIPGEDEPVLVRDEAQENWRKAYSAGLLACNGQLMCYPTGKTKWSSNGNLTFLKYWRKPGDVKS